MASSKLAFSDVSINEAIGRALLDVPPGNTWAVVAHADFTGASLTALKKVDDHWTFAGYIDKDYNGPFRGAAELRWSA